MHRTIAPSPLMNRRSLLERSGMGLGALALAGLFADQDVRDLAAATTALEGVSA